MEPRVSLITLGVEDIARSRSFYERLGWSGEGGEGGSPVFIQAGGLVLGLWGRTELATDSAAQDRGGWGGITLAHNVRSASEVDAVIDEARTAGAEILREPAETFWGGYNALFADPDGHRWEIAHNPAWEIRDDGSVEMA